MLVAVLALDAGCKAAARLHSLQLVTTCPIRLAISAIPRPPMAVTMAAAAMTVDRVPYVLAPLEHAMAAAVSAGLAVLGDEIRGAIESMAARVSRIVAPG